MSSAHIFYIPVIFMVGLLAGYFVGRRAAEAEQREEQRRLKRRKALKQQGTEGETAQEETAAKAQR
jgi:uncharacterized protein YneF (UPF0154 family)